MDVCKREAKWDFQGTEWTLYHWAPPSAKEDYGIEGSSGWTKTVYCDESAKTDKYIWVFINNYQTIITTATFPQRHQYRAFRLIISPTINDDIHRNNIYVLHI